MMTTIFDLMFWGTGVVAALLAWALLWADAQDRRRAMRAEHDRKYGCACGNTYLRGHHSHRRCEFAELF